MFDDDDFAFGVVLAGLLVGASFVAGFQVWLILEWMGW